MMPTGAVVARRPADAVPGDVHDPLLGRHARDRLLHERVLQLVAADLAQRQIQTGSGQPRAHRKSDLLILLHAVEENTGAGAGVNDGHAAVLDSAMRC